MILEPKGRHLGDFYGHRPWRLPRASGIVVLLWSVTCGALGCASKTESPRAPAGGGLKTSESESGDGGGETFAGIDLEGLAFGAYLSEAPTNFATNQVSVEYGYVDLRQLRGEDEDDIFDYRVKTVASAFAKEHLPASAASGCQLVEPLVGLTALAGTLSVESPVAKELEFSDGLARLRDADDELAFDVAGALGATLLAADGEGSVALAGARPPEPGPVQIAGAYEGTVSVNTALSELSATLGDAEDDLLFADASSTGDYDLVVVTAYGGEGADDRRVRCVFGVDGQAAMPRALYLKVLPLKGLVAHFAKIAVTTDAGLTRWTAAIAGQGVEDLRVP